MSCNPSGYYGLKLCPDTEKEISELHDKPLLELFHDLAASVRFRVSFSSFTISNPAHQEIDQLNKLQQIALIRWLAELLEVKANAQP
jgi:hypothetical protein